MPIPIPIKFLVSLLLGAAIGMEREAYERKTDKTEASGTGSLGIRSYALITTLGTVAALSIDKYYGLFVFISATFAILLIAYYIIGSFAIKDHGLTTDLAILWSYIIGLLIGLELIPLQIIIAMTVVLILILSSKAKIKSFVAGVKEYELDAFVSYSIIALVVLPILPDKSYTLADLPLLPQILKAFGINLSGLTGLELINPFGTWRIIAIITGVEMLGYVLERTIGRKKGWILTSMIGGFVSSTSTTITFAKQSKHAKSENRLVAAAILANLTSFMQLALLLSTINAMLLVSFFPPLLALIVSGIAISFFLTNKIKNDTLETDVQNFKKTSIFSIGPALQFAALFLGIKIFTKLLLKLFGDNGLIFGSMIGAASGMDAVSLNIAELAGKSVSFQTACLTLIAANTVNLLIKSVYSYFYGSKAFTFKFFLGMCLMVIASFIALGLSAFI